MEIFKIFYNSTAFLVKLWIILLIKKVLTKNPVIKLT